MFCSQDWKNELEWELVGYFFKRTVMKKSIIALVAAAAMASGVNAQEGTGGNTAGSMTIGGVGVPTIAMVSVAGLVAGGVISNNSSEDPTVGPTPGPDPEPQPTCNGDDPLVDNVCVGTTTTVTVTGTGTATSTITVPVTFTYAPSVQ